MAEELKVKISVDGSAAVVGTREVVSTTKTGTQEIVKQLNQVELSAKQTAAALRGVPAQFTDIVVSLQAGQNPMTVLLQQGGQLKDMFGGTGAAAKALGGYVMGMINPMTVAAAATAALGVAAYQGAQEHRELAKAIILSGNAAGASTDQLKGVAASVAQATGATKGALVDALGQIAQTGRVASDNMGFVAQAAVLMEKATGKAVSDSVAEFAELGKAPVEASIKLNEQYNYLTASVFAQIKALDDQGRATEAATLAQKAYADAMTERASQIKSDLGALESAWKSVGNFAKQAWDKMLNVGRESSVHEQIADLARQLQTGGFDFALTEGDVQTQIAALRDRLVNEQRVTEEKAKQSAAERAGIDWIREGDKYLSKKQQMEREITKVRQLAVAANVSELDLASRIAAIREKYEEKGRSGKSQAVKDAEALAAVFDKISSKENGFDATFYRDIDTLFKAYKRGAIDAGSYANAVEGLTKQQKFYTDELKEQQRLEAVRAKYLEDLDTETQSLVKKAEAAELENAKIGMTADQLSALVYARHQEAIAALEEKAAIVEAMAGRTAELEAIEKQIDALRRLQSADAARPRLKEQAREWERFTDGIDRTLSDALMRGFENGKSYGRNFIDSLVNSLKTSSIRLAVNYVTDGAGQIVGSLANTAINYVAGTSGANGGKGNSYLGTANTASTAYSAYNMATTALPAMYAQYQAGLPVAQWMTANYAPVVDASASIAAAAAAQAEAAANLTAAASQAAAEGNVALAAWLEAEAAKTATTTTTSAVAGSSFSSALTGIGLIISGMLMSGDAWKEGYRPNGDLHDTGDIKTSPLVLRDWEYKIQKALFGEDWAGSKTLAMLTGSSLQIKTVDKWFGGRTTAGKPELQGTFSTDGAGFTDGRVGQQITRHGGTFTRDRQWWEWQDATDQLDSALDSIFVTVSTTLLSVGQALGDESLVEKIKGFSLDISKELNESTMLTVAGQLTEAMGSILYPSIESLRKSSAVEGKLVAETWDQTFGRVMLEAGAVSRVFDMMGESLSDAFGRDNADKILAISDAFVSVFGGIDALSASFNAYYENFYSADERTAQAQEDMAKAFAALNKEMPSTRAQFRELVNAAAEAGDANLYKSLLDLQGAFAALTPSLDELAAESAQAAQAQIESQQAMARAAQEAADAIAEAAEQAAAASSQVLIDASGASQAAALEAYNAALERNNGAVNDQISAQKSLVETFRSAVANIRKYRDSLQLSELSVLDPGGKYDEARRQFDRTANLAKLGNADALADLPGIAREFLSASQDFNASGAAYLADYNQVLESLDKSEATATRNLSSMDAVADSTGRAARSLLSIDDAMQNLVATVVAAARNGVGADSGAIAAIRAAGGADKITGSGLSASYLSNRGAVAFVDGTGGISITGSQGGTISRNDFRAAAMAAGGAGNPRGIYDYAWQNGMTLNMVDALVGANIGTSEAWARAMGLPVFAQGADRLPTDMFAFVHRDERIVPAADNRRLISAVEQGGDDETKALLRELIAELRLSREANAAGQREIVLRTSQLAQRMGQIAQDGALARAA